MSATSPVKARPKALEAHATDRTEERLVLATDGGLAGLSATRWVAERAQSHVLDVDVVDVIDGNEGDERTGSDLDPRYVAAERATLQVVDHLARVAPSAETRRIVVAGDPRRVLQNAAKDADLLVIGTNRAASGGRHFTASFSTSVAEGAPCPTVVVPRGWRWSDGPVVVGVEGDGSDGAALEFAAMEAEGLHRDLVLVHAWRLATIVAPAFAAALEREALELAATIRLSEVVERMRGRYPRLQLAPVVTRDEPASAVIRAGQSASLVVVGTHGLTVIDRLLFRSVSRAVLERPSCPVAIVPPRRAIP
jgi:nucleotide-binding universal stress UspA family protein